MCRLGLLSLLVLFSCGPLDAQLDVDPPQEPALVDTAPDEVDDAGTEAPSDAGEPAEEQDAGTSDIDAGTTAPAPPDAGADAGRPAPVDAGRPATPDAGTRLRVVVLSDLNGSYGSTSYETSVHQAITALRTTVKPDLVLIAGDMVAGQQSGLDYAAMWRGFHAAVTTPLTDAGIPVAPAPGNHDASAYSGYAAERAEYARQWSPGRLPAVNLVDGSQFPFRYSFTYRGAFFIALDATTIAPLSSAQRAWVSQQLDLAAAYPVRIVYGHVPLHPTTVGRETEVLNDASLESLLASKGALFIGGHQHGYYPGVANGVRHVVTPCLGSGSRALIGTTGASPRGFVVVDIENGRVTSLEARTGSGYGSRILRSSLPAQLQSGTHRLVRDDLAGY
jgi:hypothetical protein